MPEDLISEITGKINRFIHGKLKIAKNLTVAPVDKGGLGFIDIANFLKSLQCSWVKRATGSTIDCWRRDLNNLTGLNPTILSPELIKRDQNPILYNLAESFYDFKKFYFQRNTNFLTSKILGNPNILIDRRTKIPVGNAFWATDNNIPITLLTVQVSDFLNAAGNFKSYEETAGILGANIPRDRYDQIKKLVTGSITYQSRASLATAVPDPNTLELYINRFKKGSKNFRKVFEQGLNSRIICKQLPKTKTYFRLIELEVAEEAELEKFNTEWGMAYYPPKIRDYRDVNHNMAA
jgi:hypothetical protein